MVERYGNYSNDLISILSVKVQLCEGYNKAIISTSTPALPALVECLSGQQDDPHVLTTDHHPPPSSGHPLTTCEMLTTPPVTFTPFAPHLLYANSQTPPRQMGSPRGH